MQRKQILRNLKTSRKTSGASQRSCNYKEKHSSVSMQVLQQPRQHWSAKTELSYIPSIINNDGDPLGTTISAIKEIYSKLPEGVEIVTPALPDMARL